MQQRKLGRHGMVVSAMGLGTMGMAGSYGPADESEAVATVQRGLDMGVTLIDTADFYGPGTSERIVGRALAGRRDEATVATKTGMRHGPEGPYMDGSPAYLTSAVDASLERLGTDWIDLYYLARVDRNVPVEESVGALADLVSAGKVRAIGLCEAGPATLRRASAVHPITALQTEYSLWERHVEAEILPTIRDLGIGLVAYRPLGSGFLSGTIGSPAELQEGDWRRGDPRLQPDTVEHNRRFVAALQEIAADRGVTPAQLALAWVAARGEDIIALPGCKRRSHLEENAAAVDIALSAADLDRIDASVPDGSAGDRYPAPLMRTLDR